MIKTRLIEEWSLPQYRFVPGDNPHPKKEGGHMEGQGDPVADPVELSRPEANKFFLYAIDLLNHGYFWESHVYFEALWNAHERKGSEADFFKGMIKLGAAGVKVTLNQWTHAQDHLERAVELFQSVKNVEGDSFLGFPLENLISQAKSIIQNETFDLDLSPNWT